MSKYGGRSALNPGGGGGRGGMGKGGMGATKKDARQHQAGMGTGTEMAGRMMKGNRKTAKSEMADADGGCKTQFTGHGAFRG